MSQENVDLVTRAIRAVIRRPKPDFETMNVLFHPDHVLVSIMVDKLGSEAAAVGASGYKDWLEAQEPVMSFETELGGAIDVGPDTVIAVTTMRARGASSGAITDQRVWSSRNGEARCPGTRAPAMHGMQQSPRDTVWAMPQESLEDFIRRRFIVKPAHAQTPPP